MGSLAMIVLTFVGYLVAYHTYGRFLARRVFKLHAGAQVPSHVHEDGRDYVPTRKGIIFGHHYTSIAGTGPIVGPAIGIIWGWVPALIWVFAGSIVMGAVHDFGALVISLRHDGKSIADIVSNYINPRVRVICFLIVFFELWIVIAIFALIIALLFTIYPGAVFPIWMEIPIAIGLGYAIYKRKANVAVATLIAVLAMYGTIVIGEFMPINLKKLFGPAQTGVWACILMVYAYIASTLPVTTLLQPRDFINAWQLFIATALLTAGAVGAATLGGMEIVAPAFQASPRGAPPLVPFLFVTIACGAVSGFHSLVASGTSSKQLDNERDALYVGYGSMLMESALAVLVIVAVSAGIGLAYETAGGELLTGADAWRSHYAEWLGARGLGDKLRAVVLGSANMMATIGIPKGIALILMGVFIASFAGTTLDTATRIQRYVITELAREVKLPALGNIHVATTAAIVTALALAFSSGSGEGAKRFSGAGAMQLWPMFGAVNQLLAALAFLVVTIYLKRKGGLKWLVTGLPFVFVLIVTCMAMFYNETTFFMGEQWLLAFVNGCAAMLALWMVIEGYTAFFAPSRSDGPLR